MAPPHVEKDGVYIYIDIQYSIYIYAVLACHVFRSMCFPLAVKPPLQLAVKSLWFQAQTCCPSPPLWVRQAAPEFT